MARTFGDMSEDDFATERGWLRRQTPGKLLLKVAIVLLVLGVIFGGIGFATNWFGTAVEVVSPQNVKKQWEFAYEHDKALTASANNWCSAKKAETTATGDAKDARVSQTLAQEQLYNRNKAAYDAALANAFKAKLVKPADVPERAPTLEEKVQALGLTCQ